MEEVKKNNVSEEKLPKKKNTGKIILIIILVIIGLGILCSVGTYFFARDAFYNFYGEIEEITETYENSEPISDFNNVEEGEEYPTIYDEITDEDLISDQFPQQDIPLPGGKVMSSSFTDEYSVDVNIATSSLLNDVYTWFEENLTQADWIITSKSRDDHYASISFDNGMQRYEDDEYRRGVVSISDWGEYWNYREISVSEYYY
jgi:hypothetical protein